MSDANSARDLAPIRDRATELASKLEQSEVDELESLAAPLEALLALLRPTDALTDEESSDLYAVVSQGFGPAIAIAALRGNLLIRQGHAGGAAISAVEFEADVARPSLDSTNVSSDNAGAREGSGDGGVADTETSILFERVRHKRHKLLTGVHKQDPNVCALLLELVHFTDLFRPSSLLDTLDLEGVHRVKQFPIIEDSLPGLTSLGCFEEVSPQIHEVLACPGSHAPEVSIQQRARCEVIAFTVRKKPPPGRLCWREHLGVFEQPRVQLRNEECGHVNLKVKSRRRS